MDNEKKYTTTLRLHKEHPVHAQAYRCLKNYNTDIFRTKDDFIAEAIVHFSKYLKQEEEKKQIKGWNRYLEQQNGPLLELVKRAVMEVQMEKIPDMIKNRGIWKDHIQLLIDSGILVCPHTIKKMAMPLVRSIQSIRILFMFNFLLSFYYSSNK